MTQYQQYPWGFHSGLAVSFPAHPQQHMIPPPQPKRNGIDPSAPRFVPAGHELRKYESAAMATQSATSLGSDLHQYVVDNHVKHTGDMIAIQARTNKLEADMAKNNVAANQAQALYHKILNLEDQLFAKSRLDEQTATMMTILENQAPSEEMLASYNQTAIAEAYARQIDFQKTLVARLEAEYKALVGGNKTNVNEAVEVSKVSALTLAPEVANGDTLDETLVNREETTREAMAISDSVNDVEQAAEIISGQTSSTATQIGPRIVGVWMPLAVEQMPPPQHDNMDSSTTFTWEFLKLTFQGEQWSPGFYFIPTNSHLPSRAYWVLEGDYEPCLPQRPGHHGAKLTAFFNTTVDESGNEPDESCYLNTPVFIRVPGAREYTYYGHYSQKRYSDKLDYDHVMQRIPPHVRRYWAEQLASPWRPRWVTEQLMQHFFPQPKYEGPIPRDESLEKTTESSDPGAEEDLMLQSTELKDNVRSALADYAHELLEWKGEAEFKTTLLNAGALMDAFEQADADSGLRLWWEYLECEEFNQEFYEGLVQLKVDDDKQKKKKQQEAKAKKQEEAAAKNKEAEKKQAVTAGRSVPADKGGKIGGPQKPAGGNVEATKGGGAAKIASTAQSIQGDTDSDKGKMVPAAAGVETVRPQPAKSGYVPPHLRGKK